MVSWFLFGRNESAFGFTAQDPHNFCRRGTKTWDPDVLEFIKSEYEESSADAMRSASNDAQSGSCLRTAITRCCDQHNALIRRRSNQPLSD